MLYINVSDKVMNKWGRTLDLYYAIHLSGFLDDIDSVNFLIEELGPQDVDHLFGDKQLYRCELSVLPKTGDKISIVVSREDCCAAIEYSFAKAKRTLLRRIRGMVEAMPLKQLG